MVNEDTHGRIVNYSKRKKQKKTLQSRQMLDIEYRLIKSDKVRF